MAKKTKFNQSYSLIYKTAASTIAYSIAVRRCIRNHIATPLPAKLQNYTYIEHGFFQLKLCKTQSIYVSAIIIVYMLRLQLFCRTLYLCTTRYEYSNVYALFPAIICISIQETTPPTYRNSNGNVNVIQSCLFPISTFQSIL